MNQFKPSIKNVFQLLQLMLLMFPILVILSGCGRHSLENRVFSVDDLSGKTIGVQLGTTGDIYVSDYESDGSDTTVVRYNNAPNAIQALKQGKLDAVVIDEQPAKAFINSNPDLMILGEEFANEDYAICIAKENSQLKEQINGAINHLKADGTIEYIVNHYISNPDDTNYSIPNVSGNASPSNKKLIMATNAYFPPYEYYNNGKIVGIDADIANAIAGYLGMDFEIHDMEFDSIITAVSSGKCDFGMAGITVTEERKKNISFSESYTNSKQVIVVRNNDAGYASQGLIEKFKTDFVKDGRYTYLLTGLLNTIIIALFSALIGILLGFLIAIIRSNHDQTGKLKIANTLCNIYLTVIRGTPVMVQLLIIYYVIFSSVNISKILVAIVAFGLNSGAYVAEIFRSGIMSIDKGQFEAARCLGLSYRTTMIKVILPQAFKNVLPALANEFIVLLKETSISGYIGLNDLTRGGDIIRSITYDPMLPLLCVALIYLFIVALLSLGVKKLERRLRNNER